MGPASAPPPRTNIFLPSRSDSAPNERAEPQLSSEYIDLWEHAALLYHSYEWQSAADAFLALATRITDSELSSRCRINAGLIQAHLGDFKAADATLTAALTTTTETCTFAALVIGLVSYELHDAAKAEGCFELCYDELKDGVVEYQDSGFRIGSNFVLDQRMVHENLRAVREAEYRAIVNGSSVTSLNGVPTECIFEPPPRSASNSDGTVVKQRPQSEASEVTDTSDAAAPAPLRWIKSLRSPRLPKCLAAGQPLCNIQDRGRTLQSNRMKKLPDLPPTPPPRKVSDNYATTRIHTPAAQVPRNFSAGEGAAQNRTAMYTAQPARQQPVLRNTKGECERTRELEDFLNRHLPQDTSDDESGPVGDLVRLGLARTPLTPDGSKLSSSMEQDGRRSNLVVGTSSDLPISLLGFEDVTASYASTTHSPNTSPTSFSVPYAAEVLQPVEYVPPKSRRKREARLVQQSPVYSLRRRTTPPRASDARRSQSSRASVTSIVQRERDYTLQLLEGTATRSQGYGTPVERPKDFILDYRRKTPGRGEGVVQTEREPPVEEVTASPIRPVLSPVYLDKLPSAPPVPSVDPFVDYRISRTTVATLDFFDAVVGRR